LLWCGDETVVAQAAAERDEPAVARGLAAVVAAVRPSSNSASCHATGKRWWAYPAVAGRNPADWGVCTGKNTWDIRAEPGLLHSTGEKKAAPNRHTPKYRTAVPIRQICDGHGLGIGRKKRRSPALRQCDSAR